MNPLKSVILYHTPPDTINNSPPPFNPHYDFMIQSPLIEHNRQLLTFRLHTPPHTWPINKPTKITKLPLHREIYLDYQGPISQNRGNVTQFDTGHAIPIQLSPTLYIFKLNMKITQTTLQLTHQSHDAWLAVAQQTSPS